MDDVVAPPQYVPPVYGEPLFPTHVAAVPAAFIWQYPVILLHVQFPADEQAPVDT